MTREFRITGAKHGAALTVQVVPSAGSVGNVDILEDGSLRVHLTEPSAGGRANTQLVEYLADLLDVDPAQIAVVAGQDGLKKIVSVDGVSAAWIEERLIGRLSTGQV